jgi:hypothetical protein
VLGGDLIALDGVGLGMEARMSSTKRRATLPTVKILAAIAVH